jgi:hypothetical protein
VLVPAALAVVLPLLYFGSRLLALVRSLNARRARSDTQARNE